jgi:hypothetical protein
MATTTNFGWETPDDTDLVKDGALAMRTLGNSIDTSFVDLKGGTTGQNLRKASNTDLDFTWAGDATNTVVDAAGDLLYGTAADTLGRLAIGTTGQILTVASGVPSWATPASSTPTYSGVSAYKSAGQSIDANTWTAVTFNTEDFDTDSYHSTSTNTSRFTVPSGKAGKFAFTGSISWGASNQGTFRLVAVYKNGSVFNQVVQFAGTNDGTIQPFAYVYDLAVGDYLEVFVRQNTGGALDVQGGTQQSRVAMSFLGA